MVLRIFVRTAYKRTAGMIEFFNAFCLVLALILSIIAPKILYFLIIAAIADLIRFTACGAWYLVDFHNMSHEHCPKKDDIYKQGRYLKFTLYVIGLLAILFRISEASIFVWTTIAVISIIEMLRTVAHVLQKYDRTWLIHSKGNLTGLDIVSMIRLTAAICLPFIAIQRKYGLVIALIISTALMLSSEIFEYYYARSKRLLTNRFYCWTDTVARKILFAGQLIAIAILVTKTNVAINHINIVFPLGFCILIIVVKDIVTSWWHVSGRCSFADGQNHSSYIVNIVRNWLIFFLIVISYISLLMQKAEGIQFSLSIALIASMVSLLSLFLDAESMRTASLRRGPY